MALPALVVNMVTKLGNAGKVLTSKRVYATAGCMFMMEAVESPVSMLCITAVAITYIICETLKKS